MNKAINRWLILLTGSMLAALGGAFPAFGAVNVTQHHNNPSRDGLYIDPAFTPAMAAGLARDPGFAGIIQGNVFAQPLYIEGGPGGRAVVIAVTESNNVFALDAANGGIVWRTNVGPPVAAGSLPCGNLSPYGITGTPVVDLPSRTLFLGAFVTVPGSGAIKHLIFSLAVDTGTINPGWPVDVGASARSGATIFTPTVQGQRGALAIVGNYLYVPYGGLSGDCGDYHGWVVGVPLDDPTGVVAWATQAGKGGIWAVGGIASDGTNPFVATGNTDGADSWGGGEAVIRLQPGLTLAAGITDYWAPGNWADLDSSDLDIGGSGPLLVDVPGATPSKLVVALGKDGNAYLLDRANLGGISEPLAQAPVADDSIIQAAATYRTAQGTYVVFANANNLYALLISATDPPTISNAWTQAENGRGSPFVTSTDGTNNVIVWGVGAEGDQQLHGFDGDTGNTVFDGGGAAELMTKTRRFSSGIVARGSIYVAADNRVYAFRVPAPAVAPYVLHNPTLLPDGAFQFDFTNIPGATFSVFGTPDVAQPFTNWFPLGGATEVAPGQFQFTDPPQTGTMERFYRVSSP